MSIPEIADYPLPHGDELPIARAQFVPDPARAVLLIHDMQTYFARFFGEDSQLLASLCQRIAELATHCRRAGIPVVYSAQPGDGTLDERGLLGELWGPGLLACPEQSTVLPALTPAPQDHVLRKTRYSALHNTELTTLLTTWKRDQLWICGIYAHIGCMLTATHAFMHDIKPFLVADALGDFSRSDHDMALRYVAQRCGQVLCSKAFLDTCQAVDAGVSSAPALSPPLCTTLQTLLQNLLDDPTLLLEPSADLQALGMDSIRRMELAERLADAGLPVDPGALLSAHCVADIQQHLNELQTQPLTTPAGAL